jgi:hypothetical protein
MWSNRNDAYPVVGVLSSRYSNTVWLELFTNIGMTDYIVWCRWFFNEPWFKGFELLHVLDSLRDIPDLYGGV